MKNIIVSTAVSIALVISMGGGVMAARPSAGGGTKAPTKLGIDVSYPQCGKTLPTDHAFAIVGVNNGLANDTNPCFAEQYAWAQQSTGITGQPKAAVYVNTANPGLAASVWPQSNVVDGTVISNPYGECTGAEGAACAYVYGWTRAKEDATIRNVPTPESQKWWLDVETTNSWSDTDFVANAASLEGMTAYFRSIGAQVGVYSTGYQWKTIVGNLDPASNLNGLDSWLAGALTQRGAEANCANPALTPTSKVTMTQFVSKGLDYNVSCIY